MRINKVKDLDQNALTKQILYELKSEADPINDYWVSHLYLNKKMSLFFNMGYVIERTEDDKIWNDGLKKQFYKRISTILKQLKDDGLIEQQGRKYRIKR